MTDRPAPARSVFADWLHRAADSDVWWSFKSSKLTVAAALGTLAIVVVAFASPILAPHTPFDPATLSLSDGLKPPAFWSDDGDWTFPLGTDDQGRDVLSSIMYGTRLSLVVGFASVIVAMAIGITLGLVSGYVGGAVDAVIMRLVRSEMLEVMRTDYIKFARARGLTSRAVNFGHALKNTLVPVITVAGLQLGGLIAFALVTETVFAWPGVGQLFLQSVQFSDIPVMAAYLMLIALLFVVINLVVDMLYFAVDPRLRGGGAARVGGH